MSRVLPQKGLNDHHPHFFSKGHLALAIYHTAVIFGCLAFKADYKQEHSKKMDRCVKKPWVTRLGQLHAFILHLLQNADKPRVCRQLLLLQKASGSPSPSMCDE